MQPALLLPVLFLCACGEPESEPIKDSGQACEPAEEIPYDGLDQDCDGADLSDVDGDGYDASQAGGLDCDDSNAEVNPQGDEICDYLDNDCDGLTDDEDDSVTGRIMWYADSDEDGYGDAESSMPSCEQPSGYVFENTDCDDGDAQVNPDADEVCDEIDNDCDELVDDDDDSVTGRTMWYADGDGDGYGDVTASQPACEQPSGYVGSAGDCDDNDPTLTTTCEHLADTGSVCASLMGDDDGLVPTWTGDCDTDAGYTSFGDRCYYAVQVTTFWPTARASCIAAGGYLAALTSQEEDDAVWEAASGFTHWIGGCDADVEGSWAWVTGEIWDHESWSNNEPSDSYGEDCLVQGTSGSWNDYSDSETRGGYVCEFEGVTSGG